jgi:putative nucleotidyltransferase with HDIG domain
MSQRLDSDTTNLRQWQWARVRIAIVAVLFIIALTALLLVPIFPTGQVTYAIGDVARSDVRAPRRLEYTSQIETDREKARASANVQDVYDPPETRVARQQISRAQEILAFITSVREDTYASPDEKAAMIKALPDVDLQQMLTDDKIEQILNLSDDRWVKVSDEVVQVLDQAMRTSIRADGLAQARARVSLLVNLRQMNDEEVNIVSTLVRGLVVPNTFVNVEQTEAERQKASDAVAPVVRRFEPNEIILREGDTVTDLDLEALRESGLLQSETSWRDAGGAIVLVLLVTLILGLALLRYQPHLLSGPSRSVALVGLLFIAFVVLAKVMFPGRAVLPYLYPAAALSMLVTVLLNPELAVVFSLVLGILAGQIMANSLEFTVYVAAAGIIAALVLQRVERVNAFFRAGIYVALTNVVVVLIFRLPDPNTDNVGLLTLVAVALGNGALTASLTLALFFIIGNLFDITTSLKLLELAQPSHPLQRRLLLRAPGTYHHTLMIVSLAEQAAERIGANALLVRVGAFYHDIGKTVRPQFFVENQMDGVNPHDRFDPYTSAEIISGHVTDGLELAKQYRLPSQVRAFISEHHGDGFISFMYQRAVEDAGGDASKVKKERFRYIGPKPQSRETGLVMLADSVEAIAKAKRPGSEEELEDLVERAIHRRVDEGQLDESGLTLGDLEQIRRSFVDTLKGLYHTRIEYPEPVGTGERSGQTDAAAMDVAGAAAADAETVPVTEEVAAIGASNPSVRNREPLTDDTGSDSD